MTPEAAHQFPETTLAGDGVTLRPLATADIGDVALACRDQQTLTWLPLPRPYGKPEATWFVEIFAPGMRSSGVGVVFAIEERDRLAGVIDLKHADWTARTVEVGYWVAPWSRGRGVATTATRTIAQWALREHEFERVELRAAVGNLASQRVAVKAGFQREGVARNAGYVHAGRVDLAIYSLVTGDLVDDPSASVD